MFDALIAFLTRVVRDRHGSFYTSPGLRANPDVCHAACRWFLERVRAIGLLSAMADLENLNKETLKTLQDQLTKAPQMHKELRMKIKEQAKREEDDWKQMGFQKRPQSDPAFGAVFEYHRQPNNYTSVAHAVPGIVALMRSSADNVFVYLIGPRGNHMLCLRRNVGAVIIYDPNLGILTFKLGDEPAWRGTLSEILQWYSHNMGMTRIGYLQKNI
jgi:hypothetical protein